MENLDTRNPAPTLCVCAPLPPWIFGDADRGRDVVGRWAEGARRAITEGARAPTKPDVYFIVALRSKLCAQHLDFFRSLGLLTIPIDDKFPYEPYRAPAAGREEGFTAEEMRRIYACRALMRIKILALVERSHHGGAVVWFLAHSVVPSAEDFGRAWSMLMENPRRHVCITAPIPASTGGQSNGHERSVLVELPPAAGGQESTLAILDCVVVSKVLDIGGQGLAPVVAGSLDWAMAKVDTFALAPIRVAQMAVRTVWLTRNQPDAETPGASLTMMGQSKGVTLSGESIGWFWEINQKKSARVLAVIGSTSVRARDATET